MTTLKQSFQLAVIFVGVLWMIKLVELLFWLDFSHLGVFPRNIPSFYHVLTAPMVHGSVPHLAANSLPAILLGTMLLYGYPRSRWWSIVLIWLISGIGVWVFGRPSFHIGASGLVHGLFFFLLAIAVLRRDFRSVGFMLIAVLLYGGMIWGIFPQRQGVSFEYHFFGAVGGVVSAWLFRHRDPVPVRKRYDWETEDDADKVIDMYDKREL